ncbi:MAG TPA: A/G-specific adenine glycosylase [Candidatus Paceibacterota bacterium]|nr:A/G-specific adenine glycosylase [Candidatus Paceibacterota bacterium]
MTQSEFKRVVWRYYKNYGRHELPWRKTKDPYKILVSEVMLQQTQVERVIPFYAEFTRRFPTARKLAAAPLGEVLATWQGLGYNRRAKMLRQAAKEIVEKHGGRFPRSAAELEELPGIGHYTANAVAAFAFNKDAVFVETNIRTAILHGFFSTRTSTGPPTRGAPAARPILPLAGGPASMRVSDREILQVLKRMLPRGKSRQWNLALMDYGAHLKKSGVKLNAKSKHYAKQSKFAGSNRQARGAILKELARGSAAEPRVLGLLGDNRRAQLASALTALQKEGLIQKRGKVFTLPR